MNSDEQDRQEADLPNEGGSDPIKEPANETLRQLKSAQTLVTVAAVSGPVSIFIGGVLLAGIAVISGILALVKIGKLRKQSSEYAELTKKVRTGAFVALAISVAALLLNIYALASIMPAMIDALQTGDAGNLLEDLYGGSAADSGSALDSSSGGAAQGSSIWG